MEEFEITSRARKGVLLVRDVKTNPYSIIKSIVISGKQTIGLVTNEINYLKSTDFSICDRYQTGTSLTKDKIETIFLLKKEAEEIEEEISLEKIDEEMMTIDDFLDDIQE